MSSIDRYCEYVENLLMLQYEASEIFEHNLQRGEIREDFVISQIMAMHKTIDCCKGAVDGVQGNQKDLLIPRRGATRYPLGSQVYFAPSDIVFDVEIKSNATGKDFEDFDKKSALLKSLVGGGDITCGMFCYYYKFKLENLLERFGFINIDTNSPNERVKELKIVYPNIDFVIGLDSSSNQDDGIRKSFFITKDIMSGDYIRNYETPVIKHFFSLLRRAVI